MQEMSAEKFHSAPLLTPRLSQLLPFKKGPQCLFLTPSGHRVSTDQARCCPTNWHLLAYERLYCARGDMETGGRRHISRREFEANVDLVFEIFRDKIRAQREAAERKIREKRNRRFAARIGRPCLGSRPMTSTERSRRYRARRAAERD